MKFESMALNPKTLNAVTKLGFIEATEIQSQSIPVTLSGKDLLGCAQTGSGKTLAFCLPLLNKIVENPESCALIMTPTRELAQQITDVLYDLTEELQEFEISCLIGGSPMFAQIRKLQKKPRFIVATPGRLNDHLERGTVRLSKFNILVLDEADRMLDMGFAPQIEQIMEFLPEERQTLLFSATFPNGIQKLIQKHLKNPVSVITHKPTDHVKTIKHENIRVSAEKKFDVLVDEITKRTGSILVFARTRGRTEKVCWYLKKQGINSTFIHGDRSLRERREAIQGFESGRFRVLVATDVAARGLDIPTIETVINLDLPSVAEDYVHRIGRTGRAGASGVALSFIAPDEEHLWKAISRVMNGKSGDSDSGHSSKGAPFKHKKKPFRPNRWSKKDGQSKGGSRTEGARGPKSAHGSKDRPAKQVQNARFR